MSRQQEQAQAEAKAKAITMHGGSESCVAQVLATHRKLGPDAVRQRRRLFPVEQTLIHSSPVGVRAHKGHAPIVEFIHG